jgi:hypothetical protein
MARERASFTPSSENIWMLTTLREPPSRSASRAARLALASGMLASGICASLLAACGARSSLEQIEVQTAGGSAGASAGRGNPPNPTFPAGGSEPSGGAPMMIPRPPCESVTVAIDELRPELTLLVDQSLSMRFRYPDEQSPFTRWSLMGDALFDPTRGVVKQFETSVRFGIAFFTSQSRVAGGLCPILRQVSARPRNYEPLNTLYQSLAPTGDTPTGDALQQLVTELQAVPSRGPRAILLVTDGDPDTCQQPDPDEGLPQAVAAAQRAFDSGIPMYVLGISNDIAGGNLQQLANAGKGRPLDRVWGVDAAAAQPFQATDDVQGLTAQLTEILASIPLCEVSLQRDITSDELRQSEVLLDGQPLRQSEMDGYFLRDSRHLAVVGAACDAIRAGGMRLSVRISCD